MFRHEGRWCVADTEQLLEAQVGFFSSRLWEWHCRKRNSMCKGTGVWKILLTGESHVPPSSSLIISHLLTASLLPLQAPPICSPAQGLFQKLNWFCYSLALKFYICFHYSKNIHFCKDCTFACRALWSFSVGIMLFNPIRSLCSRNTTFRDHLRLHNPASGIWEVLFLLPATLVSLPPLFLESSWLR